MWGSVIAMLGVLVVAATSANAQSSRRWVPWQEIGPPSASSTSSSRRKAQSRRQERSDDDDDNWSPFGSSRGSPFASAPRSPVQFPAIMEGGARPNITPVPPQSVALRGYTAGEVIIDTQSRALYYVTSSTSAYRYPISVGREGFTWRGTEKISRVADWPDWRPPAEMRERDPRLPELMTGGVNNPLGARALYLGNTLYRIHGTNDSRSIGYAASSGCFRMMNHHVMHLSTLVGVGTTVRVLDRLPSNPSDLAASSKARPAATAASTSVAPKKKKFL